MVVKNGGDREGGQFQLGGYCVSGSTSEIFELVQKG